MKDAAGRKGSNGGEKPADEGELKGKPALGIYKLDANQLTLCYVMPGSPRPNTFDSQPNSGAFLVTWKRAENKP